MHNIDACCSRGILDKCVSLFTESHNLKFYYFDRHTGVVVYGNEYYFGGGAQHSLAGSQT